MTPPKNIFTILLWDNATNCGVGFILRPFPQDPLETSRGVAASNQCIDISLFGICKSLTLTGFTFSRKERNKELEGLLGELAPLRGYQLN